MSRIELAFRPGYGSEGHSSSKCKDGRARSPGHLHLSTIPGAREPIEGLNLSPHSAPASYPFSICFPLMNWSRYCTDITTPSSEVVVLLPDGAEITIFVLSPEPNDTAVPSTIEQVV